MEGEAVPPLRCKVVINATEDDHEQLGQLGSFENDSRLSAVTIETLLSSTASDSSSFVPSRPTTAETVFTLSRSAAAAEQLDNAFAVADAESSTESTVQGEPNDAKVRSNGDQNSVYPLVEDKSQTGPKRPPGLRSNGEDWVKIWRRVELVFLVVSIVVVWGLLFLPVIFYYLPREEVCTNQVFSPSVW